MPHTSKKKKKKRAQKSEGQRLKLSKKQWIALILVFAFLGQLLFGMKAPDQWLVAQKTVPHQFTLDETYHTIGYNWTLANKNNTLGDYFYPINFYFSTNIWLNATGELGVGETVSFSIIIGNVEAYLPKQQKVISRNNLTFPNNDLNTVFLTNSVFANNNSNAVIKLVSIGNSNVSGYPSPSWEASGQITFNSAGDTYLRLGIPYGVKNFPVNEFNLSDPDQAHPILITNIQPESSSYSSAVLGFREAIAGSSFSWLVADAIVTLFIGKKEDDQETGAGGNPSDANKKQNESNVVGETAKSSGRTDSRSNLSKNKQNNYQDDSMPLNPT